MSSSSSSSSSSSREAMAANIHAEYEKFEKKLGDLYQRMQLQQQQVDRQAQILKEQARHILAIASGFRALKERVHELEAASGEASTIDNEYDLSWGDRLSF